MTQKQVAATKMVSRRRWNAALSGKNKPTRRAVPSTGGQKAQAAAGQGLFDVGTGRWRSIAAVYQAPARAPWRRNQLPYVAAAIAIAVPVIGRAADVEAGTAPTPAAMPTAVPASMPASVPTAPGRGGGRRQCGHTQRSCGNRNKREFA